MSCEIGSVWGREGWLAGGQCLGAMGWCQVRGQPGRAVWRPQQRHLSVFPPVP